MMIDRERRSGKAAWDRFAKPPWSQTSAEWLEVDQELEDDHLARQIDRAVACLDLTPLIESYSGHGTKPHRPDLMLKMVLFEIQRGRSSPAQWYLDAKENAPVQWLGLGIRPARSAWYEFAFRIHRFLDSWNQQVLQAAQELGHTSASRCSLDGTYVEAHASRHRLLNQGQVVRRRELLEASIQADEQGVTPTEQPRWMAKTPPTRLRQKAQYDVSHRKLAERLAENKKRIPSQRQEEKNIRISVVDPEAALGKDKLKVFRPLYNVQYVRDLDSPYILAYDVFARSSDAGTLGPMMERTQQMVGHMPTAALGDAGYITALDLVEAKRLGIDLYGPWKENDYSAKKAASKLISKDQFTWDAQTQEYRCPEGHSLTLRSSQDRKLSLGRTQKVFLYEADAATCTKCPLKQTCCPKSQSGRHINRSEHEELTEAHRRKMETPEAKTLYKLRGQTVETSFGDSKQHRNFRRVNGRGLWRARMQAAVTVLVNNLKHLVRSTFAARPSMDTT